jgi:glycosyltransferase involved in cell wall biosynthesis
VVVHVPSRGVIKGSDLIEPVLADLVERGLIDYVRVEGVPAAQMPALYTSADIVLDQFRIGNYGVAAIEAMAAGRIVIGYLHDQVRDHVLRQTGHPVPIVQASVDTLADVLEDIVANPDPYRERAADGPAFVDAVHNGAASAAVLADFLHGSGSRMLP